MSTPRKQAMSRILDLPFALSALETVLFYWVVTRPAMHGTLLHRYTTEHTVEYVVVAFFIWGLTDVFFRAAAMPREMLALKQSWLPPRSGREPVSHAIELYEIMQKKPGWMRNSRLGQRLTNALGYLVEKGSADGFSEYLQSLADQDDEQIHANYGLIRFIGWVTPVLGFLGTVLHFGTALSGLSVDQMAEKLALVVAEMGTAFNTTTGALTASTTMMFALFLCERTERGMLHATDRRAEQELLNRFEVVDESLSPYLNALKSTNATTVAAMDATIEHQLGIWTSAFRALQQDNENRQSRQSQVWEEALARMQQRFEVGESERERRLLRLLDAMENQDDQHRVQTQATVAEVSNLREDFAQLIGGLNGLMRGEGKLVELQSTLAENLRILHETQKLDEALHGLAAAIHLLTARHQPTLARDQRAA